MVARIVRWASRKWLLGGVCLLFAVSFMVADLAFAQSPRVVSVAYSLDNPPFHFRDEAGEPAGMMIDFWRLWSEKTGTPVSFVPGSWDETLAMVRDGRTDAHAGLFYSKGRDEFLDYGHPLVKTDTHIFYHESLPQLVAGNELLPYRVGVIKGDMVQSYLKDNVPGIFITPYDDYTTMMLDLRKGLLKTFASDTPTGLFYLQKNELVRDFQFHASRPLYRQDWYVAVKQGNNELLGKVKAGMNAITPEERLAIVKQWSSFGERRADDTLVLAMPRSMAPFYFVGTNGDPRGLFVDIWKLWAERSGTKIDFRPSDWQGTLEALKSGEADIHTGLFMTPQRAEWIDFSSSIYSVPSALYFKKGSPMLGLAGLSGKRVGVIAGTFHESYVKEKYPDIRVVSLPNPDALIVGLLKGDVNAIINETVITDSLLESMGFLGTIVKYPRTLFTNAFHGGVLKGNQGLLEEINSGLAALPWGELERIEAKWVPNPENRQFGVKQAMAGLGLTEEEKQWLHQHPVIRFSNETDWPPYDFMQNGQPAGYSVDYIKLLAEKIGFKVEWVNGYTWSELVDMTKKREIDVLQSVSRTPSREEYLAFPPPYHISGNVIYTRPEDSNIGDLSALNGKTLAVVKGFSIAETLGNSHPDIRQILVDSPLEGLVAVSSGKADSYIDRLTVCQYYIAKNNIPNVVFASMTGIARLDVKDMYLGVRKDWPLFVSIVEKGQNAITPGELQQLKSKWFGEVDTRSVQLSREEKDWVAGNPVVRVAATPNWPPFEFEENGVHRGVAADILKMVAERTGLQLDIQFGKWNSLLGRLREGDLDVGPAMVQTPERQEYLDFTDSVFVSHIGIWVESGREDITTMSDLPGKMVAVEEGYATHEMLKTEYPDVKLKLVTSPIEAMRLVSSGQADAYLGNQAATAYIINQHLITNLRVVGYYEDASRDLRMGVRKDLPLLTSILNKGLSTITLEEKSDLLAKYVGRGNHVERKLVELTPEEKQWISDHKDIRLGADSAWPPFESIRNGKYRGLSSELIARFAKETGLSFTDPPMEDWPQVLKMIKEKKLDVLPALSRSAKRDEYLSFSKPYTSYPIAIYQRTSSTPVRGLDGLNGKSVAVVDGYAIEEFLRHNHSGIMVHPFRNVSEAVRALAEGEVDALAGNVVAVEHAKQALSIFNVAPSFKTPYVQELRFGVRQDWPELVRIINKWLDTVDAKTFEAMAESAGVPQDLPVVEEGVEAVVDTSQLLLIGVGIVISFGLALIILLLLKRVIRKSAVNLYSSHQYKVVGIVVGLLFLCLVVVATWVALAKVEQRAKYNIGEALESVLLTTHEALQIWEQQNKNYTAALADEPVMRGLAAGLLALPRDIEVVKASPQVWNVRKLLDGIKAGRGFVDYAVISEDAVNIASAHDHDLLDKNLLSIQRPWLLERVFSGETVFIPPVTLSDYPEEEGKRVAVTVVSIVTPIRDSEGKVVAALVLSFDTGKDYQRIIGLGRLGKSGETYAVDKNGLLASQSRFDDLLQEVGLVEEGHQGLLHLRIADPGGDLTSGFALEKDTVLPLTNSAKAISLGRSGLDVQGFRDYRGVDVFGAWLWDKEMGLGLVTEIDVDEALGTYRLVRNTVVSIILVTILLGTLMTGLSNWIGQSAAKSLQKAKDELEDRVEERTAELKKITVAVEQSPATVVITDKKGTIQYVNPTFTRMTGYTHEEAIGQNPRVLKSGHHPPQHYKELWRTILSGKIWTGDFLNKKKSGELFWERASIAPIFDDDNQITNFVAVKEDITDRKAQEERFQALLDAAPDAVVLVSSNGDISLVNIATEELFGYSRDELVGEKVEILVPEVYREAHPTHRDKFFSRPGDLSLVANKDFRGQTKDGRIVPVDISLSPIETDEGIQIIASIRDITERKKAEEAIAASEERTRLILSSAGEGIFGVNLQGEVTFINEAACEMVGYTADELMGKGVHEIIHHSRPDGSHYPVEECPMRNAFVLGVASRIDDEVLWHKDGTGFEVEYAAVPIMREGEKIGAVISFQDISQRKEMERALIDAKEKAEILSRDFTNFLESTSDLVYLKDTRLRYLACSKPLAYMLGYSDWHDVVGHSDSEIANAKTSIHFASEPEMQVIEEGEVLALEENIIQHGDRMGWASTIKKPLLDGKGKTVGILSISRDITERIEMTQALESAKAETEDALGLVTSSIQYASRIQRSVLPPPWRLEENSVEHFVVWEPRDVVGGDLYWCEPWGEGCVVILGDCTGHGVPGAFMTLLSSGALENSLTSVTEGDSAGLISKMHRLIQRQLGQMDEATNSVASDDGLELGVCYIPPHWNTMTFAGARMPLFIDHEGDITQIKPDKKGIAYRGIPYDYEYTNNTIEVLDGMTFFMTTDGMIDQIGGEKRRGFGKKRFVALLESLRGIPLQEQGKKIYERLVDYQGEEKRRDDVSIIGFKL